MAVEDRRAAEPAGILHDQERPRIAENVEAAGARAVFFVESGAGQDEESNGECRNWLRKKTQSRRVC